MPILLVAVIDDAAKVWDVLEAWENLGVGDATIFESTGLHRAIGLRDDLPLFPSMHDLLQDTEAHHSTLWAVVPDGVDVQAIMRATEAVVGPLDEPHAGIMFTLPVLQVWGFRPPNKRD